MIDFPAVSVSVGGGGGGSAARMHELGELFQVDPTQQLAFKTIVSEVMRKKLMWHTRGSSSMGDATVPVPVWWTDFVADAVRAILLSGCFVYRRVAPRAGVPVCVVGDPSEVSVYWDSKKERYAVTCKKHAWKVGMVEPPLKRAQSKQGDTANVCAAAVRAYRSTVLLARATDNWTKRDALNSAPAVFTKVSDELKHQNGSDRQWFRNVNASDAMSTRAQDIDVNFHTLVHRRAETIQHLDALTNKARARSGAGLTQVGASQLEPPQKVDHSEHIVSDGRDFVERRSLSSLPDAKMHTDELRHAILFAFGVPPQALGKNINSERLASSNRLTEMALTTYTSFITLLRTRIGDAIVESTTTPDGSFVDFACCLSHYELENVQQYLKNSVVTTMLSRTFDIPASFIDASKVAALAGEQQDDGGNRKRARTDIEQAALKRAKASTPHTKA
jgi:hypothetical protein